jgi:tol-pal system protein YbgF
MQISGKISFRLLASLLGLFLIYGCGSSAPEVQSSAKTDTEKKVEQDQASDIESLLGIEASESQKKTKPQEGNDDVLTLLGAQDKPKEVSAAKSAKTSPIKKETRGAKTTAAIIPAKKSSASNPDLAAKEAEIKKLKNELKEKEAKIERLESQSSPAVQAPVMADNINEQEYTDLYQQGLNLFNNHQYKEAITVFKRLIASNDNYSLSDNAQYWIGESNYMLGNYKAAILDFEKVFTYPKSNKNDYAQFKLGKCYLRLGDKQRAREEFQRFLDQYPKSPLRAKAQKELEKL